MVPNIDRPKEDLKVTIKCLQDGRIKLMADAFLAFLWKGDLPGADYDLNDMMDSFLEGFTLECHIFMGPSTALGSQSHGM
ncbi:uncharacterized protein EDB91DRAFT_1250597 [Suillus paluster]|uniref:uncharacterized protein n=1 Tax=Suillus paluster TaxID=48578 RepID=UPI001B86B8AD|nr:uncharacterized protein EDB91DRAFT_1250597 [Suillus paluster]KAG1735071.1 hypothetical protein EDB91DRAFT_1250597 [Suillus paluster]